MTKRAELVRNPTPVRGSRPRRSQHREPVGNRRRGSESVENNVHAHAKSARKYLLSDIGAQFVSEDEDDIPSSRRRDSPALFRPPKPSNRCSLRQHLFSVRGPTIQLHSQRFKASSRSPNNNDDYDDDDVDVDVDRSSRSASVEFARPARVRRSLDGDFALLRVTATTSSILWRLLRVRGDGGGRGGGGRGGGEAFSGYVDDFRVACDFSSC